MVKTQTPTGRLRSAFPDIDLHAFRDVIRSVENGVSKLAEQVAYAPLLPGDTDARIHAARALADDDTTNYRTIRLHRGGSNRIAELR